MTRWVLTLFAAVSILCSGAAQAQGRRPLAVDDL